MTEKAKEKTKFFRKKITTRYFKDRERGLDGNKNLVNKIIAEVGTRLMCMAHLRAVEFSSSEFFAQDEYL